MFDLLVRAPTARLTFLLLLPNRQPSFLELLTDFLGLCGVNKLELVKGYLPFLACCFRAVAPLGAACEQPRMFNLVAHLFLLLLHSRQQTAAGATPRSAAFR